MRLKVTVILLLAFTFLAACNSQNDEATNNQSTEDVKELVNEYSKGNFTKGEEATITSTELMVKDGGENQSYDLSEEEFFVSIAPFVNETHP